MLAFIDSPIQIIVVMIVVLIVFGPQKLPEIGHQIGRALRDFRRAAEDLKSSINLDDKHDTTYEPPRYDSYGNPYNGSSTYTVPEEDVWQPPTPETKAQAALTSAEPPRGDFAAAALSDTSSDYGVGLSAPTPPAEAEAPTSSVPPNTVARNKS
jgi:TatA/E family protein of Tat protein translocase